MEQLKNGVQAMRMPSDSLESNWAYLVIAAQAWNLKAWLGLVQSDKTMGQRILKMEYRRFLRQVVQIPCQILQRGRRLLYRLLNVNDWTETLLSGVPSPSGSATANPPQTKQRKSTEIQGLRSRSVRKRPKIPILSSRSTPKALQQEITVGCARLALPSVQKSTTEG